MRKSVIFDADVDALIRETMRRMGQSFKHTINQAVRDGLPSLPAPAARKFRQKTHRMGVPTGFELDKALSRAAELEDVQILRKMRERKSP